MKYDADSIKRRKEINNRIKKIVFIFLVIILYNIVLLYMSYIDKFDTPSFYIYKAYLISTESMEPEIKKGDAIIIKKVDEEQLKVNDIISFQDKDFINTHRIIEIINNNGITKYKTKGDNNKREDKNQITYSKIEGVYQFRIKGFGKTVEILKNKITLVVLLIALVLISTCQVRINKKRLARKEKRYNYNKNMRNTLQY